MEVIEITAPRLSGEMIEAAIALFEKKGMGGAVQDIYVSPKGEPDYELVSVKTYLLSEDEAAFKEIELGAEILRRLMPFPELLIRRLAQKDWTEAWKEFYKPLRIGKRMVIKPTWEKMAVKPSDIVVELDPGMAFGTGMHATTRLCLQALESYFKAGESVLDVGTGSGILAIAAAKLGAAPVVALDNDPIAVKAAAENAALNGVGENISLFTGELADLPSFYPAQYDLVLANILAAPLIEMMPQLKARLAPGGILILSGLIEEQAEMMTAALQQHGLTIRQELSEDDWLALAVISE
jgi:ribosomal protein L11 methyltransferase